jgi:exosome complex component RRP41
MPYPKRLDGRKFNETREIEAKAGIIKRADGSAMFRIGKTVAYTAVYGPRNLYPKFLQNPREGIIRVNYEMMPFSSKGERVRPGPSRRSKEISMVTEKALLPVLYLEEFPNAVVDVFIAFPQTDAGTRCAGICAASIALADAGIPMKDLVAAVSVGRVDEQVLVDLCYDEEAFNGKVADIPIAMAQRSGEFSLLQMDGEIDKEQLLKALKLGQETLKKIFDAQKKALKEKYHMENGGEE